MAIRRFHFEGAFPPKQIGIRNEYLVNEADRRTNARRLGHRNVDLCPGNPRRHRTNRQAVQIRIAVTHEAVRHAGP